MLILVVAPSCLTDCLLDAAWNESDWGCIAPIWEFFIIVKYLNSDFIDLEHHHRSELNRLPNFAVLVPLCVWSVAKAIWDFRTNKWWCCLSKIRNLSHESWKCSSSSSIFFGIIAKNSLELIFVNSSSSMKSSSRPDRKAYNLWAHSRGHVRARRNQ